MSKTDEDAIRIVDCEMVAALNSRNLEKWLSFLAEEVRMMPPNEPILEGIPAIREIVTELLSLPNFSVTHNSADRIVVSDSGDLAYISYSYALTVPDSQGASKTEKGKDISIFQKQSDGSWKLVVDMWSPNGTE